MGAALKTSCLLRQGPIPYKGLNHLGLDVLDRCRDPEQDIACYLQTFGRPTCGPSKHATSGQEVTHHPLRLPRVRAWEGSYCDDL